MTSQTSQRPWVAWVVLLLVAGFMLPVVRNGLSRIDDPLVFVNPASHLNPPDFTADKALWYWRNPELGLYMPLTYTVWAAISKATYVATPDEEGLHVDPRVFHAASLLIHLANVALVYFLLRRILRRPDNLWPAAAGALLYGLHPLQVESVAWISGMKDLLSTTASVGAILLYLQALNPTNDTPNWKRITAYVAGLLLIPLGMLCKPSTMVAPLIAAVLDLLIFQRPIRKLVLAIVPYLLAAIPLAIVARNVQPWNGVPSPPIWQRPIVSGASLAFYAAKFIAPLHLGFDYGWRPLLMLSKGWFWAIGIAGLAVTIAALVFTWRRFPYLAASIAVFICGVFPVLGLTPFSYQFFSTVTDHYVVLAMLGPAIALAWCMSRLPKPWFIVVALWLLLLGGRSTLQFAHWRNSLTMARHMVDVNPASALGHNALGEIAQDADDLTTAEREFRAATTNPDFLAAPDNLARLYAAEGRPNDAIAAFHLLLQTAARFPPEAKVSYRGYCQFKLHDIAVIIRRPQDAQRYDAEEIAVYGSLLPRR